MVQVSSLHVYPVKGFRGADLESSKVQFRGLEYDRRWMLVDENGKFVSQRDDPKLCQFVGEARSDGLSLLTPYSSYHVGFERFGTERVNVRVWNSEVEAVQVSPFIDDKFSELLGFPVRLVYMPDDVIRPTHPDYTLDGDHVSFADAFPILVTSKASQNDLNSRLAEPLPMNRFRANIIVDQCEAFDEDMWAAIRIGEVNLRAAKKCGRCKVTATDQVSGQVGIEPLRTLATYRQEGKAVMFGAYFVPENEGLISVGDLVEVIDLKD